MKYDKNFRPSAKRHNYLMDEMTTANLAIHIECEKTWEDNRKIIACWKAEIKTRDDEIARLNNLLAKKTPERDRPNNTRPNALLD